MITKRNSYHWIFLSIVLLGANALGPLVTGYLNSHLVQVCSAEGYRFISINTDKNKTKNKPSIKCEKCFLSSKSFYALVPLNEISSVNRFFIFSKDQSIYKDPHYYLNSKERKKSRAPPVLV